MKTIRLKVFFLRKSRVKSNQRRHIQMMKRESRRSNRKRNMRKTLKIQMRQIRKRMLRKEKSRKKPKNLMSDPI